MTFKSILFKEEKAAHEAETAVQPAFFSDLNLDQVVDSITAEKAAYNLKPFFYSPLRDAGSIRYRQDVFRDLENAGLFGIIVSFEEKMRRMRIHLEQSKKLYYKRQQKRWFLEAAWIYCEAVTSLAADLQAAEFSSEGFSAFRRHISATVSGDAFRELAAETGSLLEELDSVRYRLLLKGTRIEVRRYESGSDYSESIESRDGFDLALAGALNREGRRVVCNDFLLQGRERVIVVSGPNQGGKTTFARAFGQMHFLGALGCPVPGSEARLLLFDNLFTHFERSEKVENLRGKLEDDLVRLRDILDRCTPQSLVILNEIFTSTSLQDAIFLGKKIMEKILALNLLCVWVTFVDEMAELDENIVSLCSTVSPEDPAQRTYRIVRKKADGLAYALSIAEKHRLTYPCLKGRLHR